MIDIYMSCKLGKLTNSDGCCYKLACCIGYIELYPGRIDARDYDHSGYHLAASKSCCPSCLV